MSIAGYSTEAADNPLAFEVVMSPKDAARILGVSTRTLTTWAKAGKLRYTKTEGGHYRYYADSVRWASQKNWEMAGTARPKEELHEDDVNIVIPVY